MKRSWMAVALLILAWGSACEKSKDVTGPGSPSGTSNLPDDIVLARTFPPLLANGIDDIEVRAMVVDARGRGLSGVGVAFTTTAGEITPYSTTETDGVARAVLASASSATDLVAVVQARASRDSVGAALGERTVLLSRTPLDGEAVATLLRDRGPAKPGTATPLGGEPLLDQVDVPMLGLSLTLKADPPAIPGDGIHTSRLEATVLETTRRVPVPSQEIRFGTTAGTITGSAVTDAAGIAAAQLTGKTGSSGAQVTAYYGGGMTAVVSVPFEAVLLSLEASSPAIPADGVSTAEVTARLTTEGGNPVPGARIDFSADLGTVASPATTDASGAARAILRAGRTTGTATVTARFEETLTGSVDVLFTEPPATASLLLSVDPNSLPADGASEARLIATALDGASNPMRDGTPVQFSILEGDGRIVGPDRETAAGTAEALYVAGTAAGTVRVRAISGAAQEEILFLLTPSGPGGLVLGGSPASILADGMASATITARVTDRNGNPVLPGTQVDFTTTQGILFDRTPTDADGNARVLLRSVAFVTGTARVVAAAEGLREVTDVRFVSEEAAHIEAVRADPQEIGVRGAGDHETSTITFEVQDRHGIPVDAGHGVVLSFAIDPSTPNDATLWPGSAQTDPHGLAATTVNAGVISGSVEIDASAGPLSAEPIRLAIHGGKPDPAHFSISFQKVNIAGLVYDGIRNAVTARVGDLHGNPVPDSTRVWFSAAYGLVQGSAGSDPFGEATVDEVTAGPHPPIPGGDGLVELCAQTVDVDGGRIETCGSVMWSGPTEVEIIEPAGGFNVANGGSIEVVFRVHDANDNPLAGGTAIAVTSTAGTLGGDVLSTLPDTQSRSYTSFGATLSDDDPDNDKPKSVTVTVTVTSQNGNRSARVTGTVR